MNISLEEVVAEFQKQYPKEFTICLQSVQIAKLQEQINAPVTEQVEPEED